MRTVSEEHARAMRERRWWGERTLGDWFRGWVALRPGQIAVTDPLDRDSLVGGAPKRLSYEALDRMVDRMAARLQTSGVEPGDVVAVQLPNVVELVAVYLAAARTGIVVSPMPVQFRSAELEELCAFVRPKAFITAMRIGDHRACDLVLRLGSRPSLVFALGGDLPDGVSPLDGPEGAVPEAVPVSADDVLTICWTSGTEGRPKGVPRSHNEWIVPAYATVDGAELVEGDHLLNPFPMVNMAGIGGMLVPWLLVGGKLVMHHPLNLPLFLRQIPEEQVHYTVAPPALLTLLLKNEALLASADISTIRAIGSGSAPLSPWMVTEWQERFGIAVTNVFGSNEGATFVSGVSAVPDPVERASFFPRFGVSGLVWPDRIASMMETRLVNPDSGDLIDRPGVPGEMRIRGAAVFSGYFRDPDRSAAAFDEDGFYRTGDLFEIDPSGRFYRHVGRAGDVINRGGVKISPEEVEAVLASHPSVAEVAVIGYPDDVMGQKVGVVAVCRDGAELTLQAVQDHVAAAGLAEFKVPERLALVDALPRNPVGKVVRTLLRDTITPG